MAESSRFAGRKRVRDEGESGSGESTEDTLTLGDSLTFSDTLMALQMMRAQFPKLDKLVRGVDQQLQEADKKAVVLLEQGCHRGSRSGVTTAEGGTDGGIRRPGARENLDLSPFPRNEKAEMSSQGGVWVPTFRQSLTLQEMKHLQILLAFLLDFRSQLGLSDSWVWRWERGGNFTVSLQPFILRSQLYSSVRDRTHVDRELEQSLKKEKALRIFKLNTGQDDHAIMFMDDYLYQVKSFSFSVTATNIDVAIKRLGMKNEGDNQVFEWFKTYVIGTKLDVGIEHHELCLLLSFGGKVEEEHVSLLINAGLLTRQLIDPNLYWFAIPNIGPVLKGLSQAVFRFGVMEAGTPLRPKADFTWTKLGVRNLDFTMGFDTM
ncbi:hypothetical protein Taro_046263 [Colocasia esculenta]|uniref:Uncharacterized protein n=1 Tax=Colocasia esculenta TaxID=4460 RepID=A0A843X1W8_COLES|nr:hypothetical protein [Colocasia esculenta]